MSEQARQNGQGGDKTYAKSPTSHTTRLLSVVEAAEVLGLTVEAVRSRIKRGTLPKQKAEDGSVYVVVETDQANAQSPDQDRQDGAQSPDQATAKSTDQVPAQMLIDQLITQLEAEREANRENRRIIAGLVQRVPELAGSPERPGAPYNASEDLGNGSVPEEDEPQKRSWWRRLFEG